MSGSPGRGQEHRRRIQNVSAIHRRSGHPEGQLEADFRFGGGWKGLLRSLERLEAGKCSQDVQET